MVSRFMLFTVQFVDEMLMQAQDTVESVHCTPISVKNILIVLEGSLRINRRAM